MTPIRDNFFKALRTLACLAVLVAAPIAGHAQTTAFTYHGQLSEHGNTANGDFDFLFSIHDSETSQTPLRPAIQVDGLNVSKGAFTVALDFGAGVFDGSARWIEIAVRRANQNNPYTTLTPRQRLTATPYALYANRAGSLDPGALIEANNPANLFAGTFVGDGSQLTNLPIEPGPEGPAGPIGMTGPQGPVGPKVMQAQQALKANRAFPARSA